MGLDLVDNTKSTYKFPTFRALHHSRIVVVHAAIAYLKDRLAHLAETSTELLITYCQGIRVLRTSLKTEGGRTRSLNWSKLPAKPVAALEREGLSGLLLYTNFSDCSGTYTPKQVFQIAKMFVTLKDRVDIAVRNLERNDIAMELGLKGLACSRRMQRRCGR